MLLTTEALAEPRVFRVRQGYVVQLTSGKVYTPGMDIVVLTESQLTAVKSQAWKVHELPYNPPRRISHLHDMRAGDKLLLERRLGGLGDVLVQTQLFPMLKDQYPDIQVDYAVPTYYQPLFEGSGVVANRKWWESEAGLGQNYHSGTNATQCRKTAMWKEYSLVEDISTCCAHYETLLHWFGTYDGNVGMKLKDRLEIWAHHIGLRVENPRTCIVLKEEEIAEAKRRFGKPTKPVLLIAPISGADSRSYPWHDEIVKQAQKQWQIFYLHHQDLGPNTLMNLTLRQMGAVVAAADVIISVDSSAFHWAGILRKPVIGLFNFLHGAETRAKYYPTATCIQACSTPCLAHKYFKDCTHRKVRLPLSAPNNRRYSTCFEQDTVEQVLNSLKGWY